MVGFKLPLDVSAAGCLVWQRAASAHSLDLSRTLHGSSSSSGLAVSPSTARSRVLAGRCSSNPLSLSLQAWVLSVPIAYACCALTGLVVHTLAVDPEMTNLSSYMNEDQTGIAARGTKYNDDVAHMFRERVAKHKFGVFNNAGN
ncbi:hypothetical protein V8C86DRAFT_834936 [Haematococcus lacustris]